MVLIQIHVKKLILALCICHLNYCNSILFGLPDITMDQDVEYTKYVCEISTE